MRRWDDNSDLLKYGVGALVHGLLDAIVDGHFEAVQILDDAMEALEDGLFDDNALNGEVQRATYQIRKDLVELRRVVLPMREVINAVLRHRKDFNAPHRTRPLVRRPLRPRPARVGMDRVAARHGHHDLRDQPVAAGRPPEQRHEEADVVGGDHRRADRRHRLLRPERPLPGLRQGMGVGQQRVW